MKNPTRSQTLDLLRFPLALVVLFVHTFSTHLLPAGVSGAATEGFLAFVEAFLRGQSVPIYYFISGYVFFLGVDFSSQVYLKKLRNRFHSLLLPYLVWNGVATLLILLKTQPFLRAYTGASVGDGVHFTLHGLLSCFWVYRGELSPPTDAATMVADSMAPLNIPLWFLRNLMVVALTTPLLHWLLKRMGGYVVVLLGALLFLSPCLGNLDRLSLLTAYFFFSWGAYMSVSKKDMLAEFGRFFAPCAVLYPLMGLAYMVFVERDYQVALVFYQLRIIAGLLLAYNLAAWLLRKGYCRVHPFLASSSFFIYVSHALLCGGLVKALFVLCPWLRHCPLLAFAAGFAGTALFLLAAYRLMDRHCPRLLNVIAGRKRK